MKKILVIIGILVTLLALPLGIFFIQQRQDIRSKAAPATSLSLKPAQVTKQVGDTFNLDVGIDTGENQVYVVIVDVTYDPTRLEATSINNGTLFPKVINSGVVDPSGRVSITIGSTEPVNGVGTAATIRFKALASTTGPIQVTFDAQNSFAGADQAVEPTINVLTRTNPSMVTITGGETGITPTQTPTVTPPGGELTPTLTPTPTTTGSAETSSSISITTPSTNGTSYTTRPTFEGTAPPGTTVTITIYSAPHTAVVTADANGRWTYTPVNSLEVGPHDVVITAQATDGTPLTANTSFVIASSATSSGSQETQSAIPTAGTVETTIAVVALGLLLVFFGVALPFVRI